MYKSRMLVLAAGFAVVACDVAQDEIAGPSFRSGSQVVGHANGDGVFDIGAPGADIALTLNALSRADGGATGSVTYFGDLSEFGLATIDLRFDVTCLARDVAQGRTWIGGVVTHNASTNPTFANEPRRQVGRDVWFRIQDNGNGGSGTLDRTTQLGFEGSGGILTSAEYCAARVWPAAPAHILHSGNISLR